jgi:hypothetical protein
MTRRISGVALVVALVMASLPAQVFADDSRPLASLRTAEGLNDALQAGSAANAQDPTRRAGSGVQVQRQQGSGSFMSSTTGKVAIAAAIAVGVFFAASTWNDPKPRSIHD